jgi:hypothetical protein
MRFMMFVRADRNTEAGVMLAGDGIQPSAKGARDEAVAWAKRVPFAAGEVIEIRQVFEAADFQ